MPTKARDWNAWGNTNAGGTLTIPAGSDRVLVVMGAYRAKTVATGATCGGVPATGFLEANAGASTPEVAWLAYWNEAAIASMSGSDLVMSYDSGAPGNSTQRWSYITLEDCNQTFTTDESIFDGNTTDVFTSGLVADGDDFGAAIFCGTSDTTQTVSAGWDELVDYQSGSNTHTIGAAEGINLSAANQNVTFTRSTARQDNGIVGIIVDNKEVTTGILNVNGNDEVDNETTLNTINGSGFTGATAVQIGGVTQPDFNLVSDTEVTFTSDRGNNKYTGVNENLTLVGPGFTHPILFNPPPGNDYIDVSGLPWPASSRSIFAGLSPAVANGDQATYELVTSRGNAVTMNPDGTYEIGPTDTNPQNFGYRVHRAADANQWSADLTQYINYTPVITNVGVNDLSDVLDTNIPIDGDFFGAEQLGSKVYLNMNSAGKDGNEVEQPIASWSNRQIVLSSWVQGALPGGVKMQVIVEVE